MALKAHKVQREFKFLQISNISIVFNNLEIAIAADIPDFSQEGDEVFLFSPVLHGKEPNLFKEFWK